MERICKICKTQETSKWFTGPMCRRCYRAQPRINNMERLSRLKKIGHYNAVAKQYCLNNIEKIKNKNAAHYTNNRDRLLSGKKMYRASNRKKISNKANIYQSDRRLHDTNYRLCCNIRSRLSKATSNKSGSSIKDLGCSVEHLRQHLESQFKPGMSWDTYGMNGWHIDHIIPLSSFNLSDSEQFKIACHYSNLQPLWAVDNLLKSNKVLKHEE